MKPASETAAAPFAERLAADWASCMPAMRDALAGASVLVVGGAGTIGAACVEALLGFSPRRIDILDIDENGLARLARDIRARFLGGLSTELRFVALDFGAWPAHAFLSAAGPYEAAFNLAAVKHVRSEKNVFTLLHMIDTNVVKQRALLCRLTDERLTRRYFAVSTDKAADPASFMGATKRMLEALVLGVPPTPGLQRAMARFANVAYSSGSLLESFRIRLQAGQPLAIPRDTRRYFITANDAARICLIAGLTLGDGSLIVPSLQPDQHAEDLAETVTGFLAGHRLKPRFFEDIAELSAWIAAPPATGFHPVLLTTRDTAGEKEIETFAGAFEATFSIGRHALEGLATRHPPGDIVSAAIAELAAFLEPGTRPPTPARLEEIFARAIPGFRHMAGAANLDDRL